MTVKEVNHKLLLCHFRIVKVSNDLTRKSGAWDRPVGAFLKTHMLKNGSYLSLCICTDPLSHF